MRLRSSHRHFPVSRRGRWRAGNRAGRRAFAKHHCEAVRRLLCRSLECLYEGHQNLRAQHFASNGTPLADEPLQITTGGAAYPYDNVLGTSGGNVAVLPDGTMFVTYYDSENQDVYGQLFNTSGPIGELARSRTATVSKASRIIALCRTAICSLSGRSRTVQLTPMSSAAECVFVERNKNLSATRSGSAPMTPATFRMPRSYRWCTALLLSSGRTRRRKARHRLSAR